MVFWTSHLFMPEFSWMIPSSPAKSSSCLAWTWLMLLTQGRPPHPWPVLQFPSELAAEWRSTLKDCLSQTGKITLECQGEQVREQGSRLWVALGVEKQLNNNTAYPPPHPNLPHVSLHLCPHLLPFTSCHQRHWQHVSILLPLKFLKRLPFGGRCLGKALPAPHQPGCTCALPPSTPPTCQATLLIMPYACFMALSLIWSNWEDLLNFRTGFHLIFPFK